MQRVKAGVCAGPLRLGGVATEQGGRCWGFAAPRWDGEGAQAHGCRGCLLRGGAHEEELADFSLVASLVSIRLPARERGSGHRMAQENREEEKGDARGGAAKLAR